MRRNHVPSDDPSATLEGIALDPIVSVFNAAFNTKPSIVVFKEILAGVSVSPDSVQVEGDVTGLRRLLALMGDIFRAFQQKESSISPLQLRTGR